MTRIGKLQHELYGLQQRILTVTEFLTKLKMLREELEHYRPPFICVCPVKCSCIGCRNLSLHRNQDYTLHFLYGLNDEYVRVQSQILLTDPMPALNKVFSMVQQ